MIRSDKFLISQRPFAIDLATVAGENTRQGDRFTFSGRCEALWFRRNGGVTRACAGHLMLFRHHMAAPVDLSDPVAILSADLDGRYGGTTHARWDGARYWGDEDVEEMRRYLDVLKPMLAAYPALPAGHNGWWRYNA